MKPQCETVADCLEQLARVMREFGFTSIADVFSSGYVLRRNEINTDYNDLSFEVPEEWSFAIAKLEDKPVFIGSEVFHPKLGYVKAVQVKDVLLYSVEEATGNIFMYRTNEYSWTPPKQTVTLKVGDNEPVEVEKAFTYTYKNIQDNYITMYHHETLEAAEQFRRAMKPLVRE